MIEAGADALTYRTEADYADLRGDAKAVLVAALAGRTVVALPEPDGVDDGVPVWTVPAGEVQIGHLGPIPVISTPQGYPTLEQAEREALVLLAAVRDVRRLASESRKDGETHG